MVYNMVNITHIPLLHDLYHGMYQDIYHMVFTTWYISVIVWYIPSKSGIYHEATFTM
jgi:hypothetical protein